MSRNLNFPSKNPLPKNKFDQKNSLLLMSQKLFLDTTKFFLECYQTSNNTSLFSKKFIEECPLYSPESQIPESYEKLQKPYNRNLAFYIRHGPHGGYIKSHQFFKNVNRNFYPKIPLKLSPFCELEMKTNNIFMKNFEVKKVEEKEEEKEKEKEEEIKEIKFNDKDQLIKELNLDDIFGIDFNPFKINNNYIKHDKYDVNIKIPGKLWKVKLCSEDSSTIYGPYISEFVYNFLKNYYMPMKKKGVNLFNGYTLLITDTTSDVHYLPEMLLNILDQQKEKTENDKSDKDVKNIIINNI